ncbi:hypothetical protein J3R30DRAFT_3694578 [Lentinula aciculospora]|uniref:Uncharacterized protein n=1 Tax=Lentinula aciculospora TaxID=153920 RepID=A0A9W9AWY9_9AGAR|nr:hypothetical protein J3R30DRAFT_3694578 [Lentinula aciculospora]
MAVIQLLFACCARGRTRRRRREGLDEQVILDEESRLIPPTVEPEPAVPDAVAQEIEERRARLGTIVRAKEGNMINTSAYAPFNVLNRPNRYSPQRYGPNRSGSNGRSVSRSLSRDPSTTRRPSHSTHSVVRHGPSYLSQGYGYGAVGVSYNPSLVHTISIPAALEPQSSELQVHIESAKDGRASLERSGSRKGGSKKTVSDNESGGGNGSGVEDNSNDKPQPRPAPHPHPRFHSTLVMSPSSTSLLKSTSHESFSDSNHSHSYSNSDKVTLGGGMMKTGEGLGVRLVQPPLFASSTNGEGHVGIGPITGLGMSRRGRPKVKTRGGSFSSPAGSGYASASGSSGNLVRVHSKEMETGTGEVAANGSGQSSSEQTPRPLSIIPLIGSVGSAGVSNSTSPAAPFPSFLAPPPSPHSDRNSDSGQSVLHTPPQVPSPLPIFEIKDAGELTIGWDD